jgi:hypothetical protein
LLSPMLSQNNYCNNERRHVSLSCDSKAMRVKTLDMSVLSLTR